MTFKNSIVAILMLTALLTLGACGPDDHAEVTQDTTNNDIKNDIDDSETGENPADTGESYGFKKFELEIDYPEQEEALKVNYEESKDSTDAEYKTIGNDIALDSGDENIDATGDEAMAHLRTLLTDLQLKEDMDDEEIISQIIKTFDVKDDYTKIEVDITWLNKEETKIEMTQ